MDDAFQFVLRNIHLGAKIEGLYRKDIYELPPDSIRELIINAVMNCNFLASSHIQIAIYDDRLEITSPGGLMPGMSIQKMKEGYSQIRNKALARAFGYMNMIEGWGTGIPKLLREMEECGLPEPEFIDMEGALRINLYRAENASGGGETDEETKISEESGGGVCNNSIILEALYDDPTITQGQLAEKLGITYSRVRYAMEKMRSDGILVRVGSTKAGRWEIREKNNESVKK